MSNLLPGGVRLLQRRALPALFSSPFSTPTLVTSITSTKPLYEHHELHVDGNPYAHHGHEAEGVRQSHNPYSEGYTHHYVVKPLDSPPRFPLTPNYNRTILAPRDYLPQSEPTKTTPPTSHHYTQTSPTSTSADTESRKIAVVLSGSGVHDGSEIQETVSLLIHLSRLNAEVKCFAPDIPQADVINHLKGAPVEEERNVLVEGARITRGKIKPLTALKADDFDAVIFPGGYGVAKTLSTFATQGENYTINPEVERVLKAFHKDRKPIGLLCVAPVLVAKLIPGVTITLGNEDQDIVEVMKKVGAKPVSLKVSEVAVDEENNVLSSPAYMTNSPVHKVFEGIGTFVEVLLKRV